MPPTLSHMTARCTTQPQANSHILDYFVFYDLSYPKPNIITPARASRHSGGGGRQGHFFIFFFSTGGRETHPPQPFCVSPIPIAPHTHRHTHTHNHTHTNTHTHSLTLTHTLTHTHTKTHTHTHTHTRKLALRSDLRKKR